MRNKTCLVVVLVLLGVMTCAFNTVPVNAETIYIRGDGSIDQTAQFVFTDDNVTYTLRADMINCNLTVERDNIIVDGAGFSIQGFTSHAMFLSGRTNVTVRNVQMQFCRRGIFIADSSNLTLINNTMSNNERGIFLVNSSDNDISENSVHDNTQAGIWLDSSNNNSLHGNNITRNSDGITLRSSSDNNFSGNALSYNNFALDIQGNTLQQFINFIDSSNLVDEKPLYYLINPSSLVVSSQSYPAIGYLAIVNGTNVTVENLTLTSNGQGVLFAFASNSTVTKNKIASNKYGVYIYASSNNTVSENEVTNNSNGILVQTCNSTRIAANNITANRLPPLSSIDAGNGLILTQASDSNVCGNTIARHLIGIDIRESANNVFYHNNLINNNEQVYFETTPLPNTWNDNYPSGGNYWSNYGGRDFMSGGNQNETGSDGTGDVPQTLETSNSDRYPLMGPFTRFDAGVWNGTFHSVDVISNSSLSDFSFNPNEGPFIRFNVTGTNETLGFCRVTIPKTLLWVEDGWKVYVADQLVNCTLIPDPNHTCLYFNYDHTTTTVRIEGTHSVMEFTAGTFLVFLVTLSVLIVVLAKKKNMQDLSGRYARALDCNA